MNSREKAKYCQKAVYARKVLHPCCRKLVLWLLVPVFAIILSSCAGQPADTLPPETNETETVTAVSPTSVPATTPSPVPTPEPTPVPSPVPTPEPTPIPEPSKMLKAIYADVICFEYNSDQAPHIDYLSFEATVGYLQGPDHNGFLEVLLGNGQIAYCRNEHLADTDYVLYARTIEGLAASALPRADDADPEVDTELKPIKLVDVRQYAPEIQIYQIFATDKNFTGKVLYQRPLCLLQEGTLQKLRKAQEVFSRDGYTIKIYDAYRPYHITVELARHMDNPIYVASPLTGSHHNRGAAIDMTLVDADGNELEMPSLVHTLDFRASRDNPDMSEAARRNMDYMSDVMQRSGFILYRHEWWHFTDTNRSNYPIMDYNLDEIEVVAGPAIVVKHKPPLKDPLKTGFVSVSPTPSPVPTPTPEPTPSPVPTPTPEPTPAPTSTQKPTPEPIQD